MASITIENFELRKGGSYHQGPSGKMYHFAPNEHGRHVAQVSNQADIQRFFQLPAFGLYDPDATDDDVEPEMGGAVFQAQQSELPQTSEAPIVRARPQYEAMNRMQLEEAYRSLYGQAPNPRTKDEKLLQRTIEKWEELHGDPENPAPVKPDPEPADDEGDDSDSDDEKKDAGSDDPGKSDDDAKGDAGEGEKEAGGKE